MIAPVVGGLKAPALIGDHPGLNDGAWTFIGTFDGNLGTIGFIVLAVFVVTWIRYVTVRKINGDDRAELGRN